jgi:predicted metal-dependent peptidase
MPPTPETTEREAMMRLAATRALLAQDVAPYFARILYSFVFVTVRGLGTVAVDKECRFFLDPDFVLGLPPRLLRGATLHEVGHVNDDHLGRGERLGVTAETQPLWNAAGDTAWNDLLKGWAETATLTRKVNGKAVTEPAFDVGEDWLYSAPQGLPPGKTAEEYYRLLREQQAKKPQQPKQGQPGQQPGQGGQPQGGNKPGQQPGQPGQQPGQGGGQPQPGETGFGGSPADAAGNGQPGQPPASPGKGACGSCAGQHDAGMADIHRRAIEQHGSLPEGRSQAEQAVTRRLVAADVVKHAEQHGRGSVPGGLLRWAEEQLGEARVPWQQRLSTLVKHGLASAAGKADFSFAVPARRSAATPRIVLPALRAPKATVAVVADTSGSMGTSDLTAGLREVRGLLHSTNVEEVWWIPTDAEAEKATRIVTAKQARDRLYGGGGTNMGAGLTAASKLRRAPHVTVVLTDGDTGWPRERPAKCGTVVVVLTRESSHPVPSWAKVVHAY